MGRAKVKTFIVVILYSIFITMIVILGILFFRKETYQKAADTKSLPAYLITEQSFADVYLNGSIDLDPAHIINSNEFGTAYINTTFAKLPLFILLFCTVIIIATFLLLSVLHHIEHKAVSDIVKNLNTLEGNHNAELNPMIAATYENIRQKFDGHMQDYKRLNSYLSHDQKNAIAILRAKLELSENSDYIQCLDHISDNIDDILTLSDSSDASHMETVDVGLICANVCDNYSKLYDKITFQFDEDANTTILAKDRWIYRVVSNLLDNAVKYGNDSLIEVSISNIHNSVIVTVKDQGIGIKPDELDKIFDNHYRLRELKRDGYGIGLSVVSHVCDICSGFCWVESEKGKGTVFTLSFPELC